VFSIGDELSEEKLLRLHVEFFHRRRRPNCFAPHLVRQMLGANA